MAGTLIYNPQDQFGRDLAYLDLVTGKLPVDLIDIPIASPTRTGTVTMAPGAITTIVYDKLQTDAAISGALTGSVTTINKGDGSSNNFTIDRTGSTVTITVKNADSNISGLVVLTDSLISGEDASQGIAATPKAIKDVFTLANTKISGIEFNNSYNSVTNVKGFSLFSEGPLLIKHTPGTLASKAAPYLYLDKGMTKTWLSLGSAAYAELSASTSSTSNTTAATSLAVKTAYDLASTKIEGVNLYQGSTTLTNYKDLNFTSSDSTIIISLNPGGAADIDLTANLVAIEAGLNLGTAAHVNTGIASGNVPVLDANGKLPDSVIGDIALFDKFDVATADTKQQIIDAINLIVTPPTPKKGDMIFVLAGAMLGTYWIITTKLPGQYTVDDIQGIQVPVGSVNNISFLGNTYQPVNGLVTLPALIPWNQISNVPNGSITNSGIVRLIDSTTSTSNSLAATANAVKVTYDLASSKISNITSDTIDQNADVSLIVSDVVSATKNIVARINTAFANGPLVTVASNKKLISDFHTTEFIKNRVFNKEVTFTSADVTGTTLGITGTYEYTWTAPSGSTRASSPRILQVILNTGLTVSVPIQYNDGTKKATVLFYDVGDDVTKVYGGVFNTPSNIHRLVISQTEAL